MAKASDGVIIFLGATPLIIADATVSEDHSRSAKVSQHPRETGADISDSYKAGQRELGVTFVISETPLGYAPEPERPREVYEQLLALQQDANLVDIQTTLGLYSNCALKEVSAPRSSSSGGSVVISSTWAVIERVETQETEIPAAILRGMVRASGKAKDKTKDQTGEPTAETIAAEASEMAKEAKRSILKGLKTTGGA